MNNNHTGQIAGVDPLVLVILLLSAGLVGMFLFSVFWTKWKEQEQVRKIMEDQQKWLWKQKVYEQKGGRAGSRDWPGGAPVNTPQPPPGSCN